MEKLFSTVMIHMNQLLSRNSKMLASSAVLATSKNFQGILKRNYSISSSSICSGADFFSSGRVMICKNDLRLNSIAFARSSWKVVHSDQQRFSSIWKSKVKRWQPQSMPDGVSFTCFPKRKYSFKTTRPSNSKNLDKVKEYASHAYQAVPDFNRLIQEFERVKERPKRVLVILLLVITTLATTLYTYWDHVKSFFGQQGAEVASMTLKSENLQRTSIEVVNNVLTDSNTTNKVVELLRDLVSRDDTKSLLVGLLVRLMKDETTKEQLGILLSEQLKLLLKDPNTMEVVSIFVGELLKKEQTKEQLIYLVQNVLNDPNFRTYAQVWASELVKSDLVLQSGASAGKDIVDAVLTNANVRKAGVDYLSNVVSNDEVQASAGHALRQAALISINPWHSSKPRESIDIDSPPQTQSEDS